MRILSVLSIFSLCMVVLIGCGAEPIKQPTSNELTKGLDEERARREAANRRAPSEAEQQATSTVPTESSVSPMTSGAVGGVTPMGGSESLGGSGGGIGSAAKDQARDAAANVAGGTPSPEPIDP